LRAFADLGGKTGKYSCKCPKRFKVFLHYPIAEVNKIIKLYSER